MKTRMKIRMNARINDMMKQFASMIDLQQNTMMSVSQNVEHTASASSASSTSSDSLTSSVSSDFSNPHAFSVSFTSFASLAKQLRAENVKYFDLEIKQKNEKKNEKLRSSLAQLLVVSVDKHVYYINVYTFVDRLKNLAKSHDVKSVINVLTSCFRGGTLMWYFMKLNDIQRNDFRTNDLKLWYITLIDRFKIKTVVALSLLISNRYGLPSIRNIKPRVWAMQMCYFAKTAAFDSTYNQLTIM